MKAKSNRKKSVKQSKQLSKLKNEFLHYYSKLPIQKLAAEFIGRDEDTIIKWKRNDKNFADQIASAKSEWALEKVGKVRKAEWLLERILSEHFIEKKEVDFGVNEEMEKALDRMSKLLPN